jgi:type VI secretion system protein ImpH
VEDLAGPDGHAAASMSIEWPALLIRRLARATLAQAARVIEQAAHRRGHRGEVGFDLTPDEETIRFVASPRLHLVANDIAAVEPGETAIRVVGNVMGLAGATPALPASYSELQLQRRRARDHSYGDFLNIFDHRALSFFVRATRKYRWALLAERSGMGAEDPVRELVLSLAGMGVAGTRTRLAVEDAALVRLAANLADQRRSGRGIETILRELTGLSLHLEEVTPVWMPVPRAEQSRLGQRYAQLGSDPGERAPGVAQAVMIGGAVLDVQHHYTAVLGPLSYGQLYTFCTSSEAQRRIAQVCVLAAGIEHRPALRLLVAVADIPPLRLRVPGDGTIDGAMLGRTAWLGRPESHDGIARDCTIPVSLAALQ